MSSYNNTISSNNGGRSSSARREWSNAKQRLMKEAADLAVNPIENCSAAPLENNILEWHANISTPLYEGVCFHFILTFTEDYPKIAPKVKVCNHIVHPNVFGEYLCLDILTMSKETENTPYRGWTSAYTVSSLLVQLQCFLFDLPKGGRYTYGQCDHQYNAALSYKCQICGHCGTEPFPPVKPAKREPGFYRLRRLALVRETADLKSPHVCNLDHNTCVEITKMEGHRARINLQHHQDVASGVDIGYCSAFTKQGVLTEFILPILPLGVYKTKKSAKVFRKDKTLMFQMKRKMQVSVEKFLPFQDQVLAKLSDIPSRYSEPSIDMDDLYVDATLLKLVSKFDEVVEKKAVLSGESCWLHEFYGDVLDIILAMLDGDTVNSLSLCHEDLKKKVSNSQILSMRNYRCFFTLKTMRDEDTVIGVGIKTDVMPRRSRHKKVVVRGRTYDAKRDVLQRLHPSFDYVAYEAFSDFKVSSNVWKDCVDMDAFLPLFINKTHGKRALPLAEKCILAMWKKENKKNSLNCERLMETLAKLMNTTVVNMNKCVDDVEAEEIQLFDSIKALEGYMGFHHLLLAFAIKYPQLIEIANEKIRNFCKNPSIRDKEITPDVGELIVYLSISKYSWKQFFPAYAREVFDRNARWILSKYPALRHLEEDNYRSCIRMTQSFLASKTGLRLAAFQSFFMNEIASPSELQRRENKVQILFKEYNSRLGKPVEGMAERLQIHSRKVLAMSNWFDYFNLVGFAAPTSVELSSWLRQSIARSSLKKYHIETLILKYKESHIESPHNTKHKNPFLCMCAGGQVFNLQDATSMETCTLVSKPKDRIDIAFVIDCSGSMGCWLTQAKNSIQHIIKDVSEKTQFKKVRFALVPYRDHEPSGVRGYVVQKYEFTSNIHEMQKNVSTLAPVGGTDNPEAMSCALATAAELSWNRDAMQLLIHIGDANPHGLSPRERDNFPNGCPCGHDALRVAHNLAKKGIPIYNVFCGRSKGGLTATFYRALSHITNGQCVSLENAETLSKIVLGAAMEEQTMDRISRTVAPMWDRVHERHPNARDDQIIYELYQRLKQLKFEVECVLGGEEGSISHSIETIAFCTDIKQCRAMQTKGGEYFHSYSGGDGQITKATKKLINEGQVRKWYKRNKTMLAIAQFKKQGCQYAQPHWQKPAAEERQNICGIAKFSARSVRPWAKVDSRHVQKIFKQAGKIAEEGSSGTPLLMKGGAAATTSTVAWGTTTQPTGPNRNAAPRAVAPQPRPLGVGPMQPRNAAPGPIQNSALRTGPSRPTQPRNAAPGPIQNSALRTGPSRPTQPRNAAPGPIQNSALRTAPSRPRNAAPGPIQNSALRTAPSRPMQPRNAAPGPIQNSALRTAPMQPRNAAPGPIQNLAPFSNMGRAPAPMTRNTSYPVNNASRSSSRSLNTNPNFPGRGAPIQSIRTASRSNSSQRTRGAPIQSIRSSRSTSREPQRQMTSNPSRSFGSAPSTGTRPPQSSPNPRPMVSQPPAPYRPMMSQPPAPYPDRRSRSSSGSTQSIDSRKVVVSFNTNKIMTDLISQRLQRAGVSAPVNIQMQDGHAVVSFNSSTDAVVALRSRLSQMEVKTVEQFRQTKI